MEDIDWVHPSIRDVVIDYLASHDQERESFIQTMGLEGVGLALSTAGGQTGMRSLPLLQNVHDWSLLNQRVLGLLPGMSEGDLLALMRILLSFHSSGEIASHRMDAKKLTTEALQSMRIRWTESKETISELALLAFYSLGISAKIYCDSPDLWPSWNDLLTRAEANSDFDAAKDLLSFASLLGRFEPRFLLVARFNETSGRIFENLTQIMNADLSGMETLDEEETVWESWGNHEIEVPVEPDSSESDELERLETYSSFLVELGQHPFIERKVVDSLTATVDSRADERQSRRERFDNYQSPDNDDDDDYERFSEASPSFDISEYFSDL